MSSGRRYRIKGRGSGRGREGRNRVGGLDICLGARKFLVTPLAESSADGRFLVTDVRTVYIRYATAESE